MLKTIIFKFKRLLAAMLDVVIFIKSCHISVKFNANCTFCLGKSFLIKVIKDAVRLHYPSPNNQFDPVCVIAPTGVAAFNVGGVTIHKYK